MRIGLLSDTHGRTGRLRKALEALAAHDPHALVHCGDIGSADCVELLASAGVPSYLTLGNMDRDAAGLFEAAETVGMTASHDRVEVPLGDGRYLAATHGHHEALLNELVAGEQFPYVCHGHSHRIRDERIGGVRVINPGALHHPRAGAPSVAILDTDTDRLIHLPILTG